MNIAPSPLTYRSKISQNNSDFEFFCTQLKILEKTDTFVLKEFFNNQSPENYFQDKVNKRWGLKKKNEHFQTYKVIFGKNGEVEEEKVTKCYNHYNDFMKFRNIAIQALQKMAIFMNWQNQTHFMTLSFMQHQLSGPEIIPGIEFHKDSSHYTLVILLDDSNDPITGWEGGQFLFHEKNCPKNEVIMKPENGFGILFSNIGTQHAITPLKMKNPSEKWVDRTILTIHEYS